MAEAGISHDLQAIRMLLDRHAPDWAELELTERPHSGTDNAMYRLGPHLAVRVPKRQSAKTLLAKEAAWLLRFGPLSLAIPRPHLVIAPSPEAPYPIVVVDWLEGEPASAFTDPVETARDLAWFLRGLHAQPTTGAPLAGPENHYRGASLDNLNTGTLEAIAALSDEVRTDKAQEIWDDALASPFQGRGVWLHGDLSAQNALQRNGVLASILDWSLAAVGDPTVDLAARWRLLPREAEDTFVEAIGASDATWARAKGWALYMAVIALAYYRDTGEHSALCRDCRATLRRLGVDTDARS